MRKHVGTAGWILATAIIVAGTAWGQTAPTEKDIALLIRDLGADRYDKREAATEALKKIGLPALKALEEAAKSDDPEVSTRAKRIVADVRLGIGPDWPADLTLEARHYNQVTDLGQRQNILRRLTDGLREKAIPFLVAQMESKEEGEARYALDCVRRINTDEGYRKLLEILSEPKTAQQASAMVLACQRLGLTDAAVKLLASGKLDDSTRRQVTEDGVRQVERLLDERQYAKGAETAGLFAGAAATEARFLYLQAEALTALEEDAKAQALEAKAAALNPDSEETHYIAGELLMKRGFNVLAAKEWETILKIAPTGEIYDINAYFRMGAIYQSSGLYEKAADALEKGLDIWEKAGKFGGMMGGTPEGLKAQIEELRKKAKESPAPAKGEIKDPIGAEELHVTVTVDVKDGKLRELQTELGRVAAELTVNVQPEGVRIFDTAPTTLKYDAAKKELAVMLDGKPCGKPTHFETKEDKARVAVNAMDCCYIFEIDTATGKSEKLLRFEKDYLVKLEPGIKLRGLATPKVTVDGKEYEWDAVTKGSVGFDYMPATLKITLEGTSPKGRHVSIKTEGPFKEPSLRLTLKPTIRPGRAPVLR